jgi:hypothetical protein
VSSPLVVEHFDVIEQLHLGLAATLKVLAELTLHGREPTLHHGVVEAVAACIARRAVRRQIDVDHMRL